MPKKKIQEYVLGFLFDQPVTQVALIQKARPTWQAGLMNGVGGHMEDHEDCPKEALIREFFEETGVVFRDWRYFLTFDGDDFAVHCFTGTSDEVLGVKTTTDEPVVLFPLSDVFSGRHTLLPSIPWLIGMALDPSRANYTPRIRYRKEF